LRPLRTAREQRLRDLQERARWIYEAQHAPTVAEWMERAESRAGDRASQLALDLHPGNLAGRHGSASGPSAAAQAGISRARSSFDVALNLLGPPPTAQPRPADPDPRPRAGQS